MLTYNLEQRNDEPKYYYIYKMIRKDIEDGALKREEKLPSKRSLAEHLGVSLITDIMSARFMRSLRASRWIRSFACCRRNRNRSRMDD